MIRDMVEIGWHAGVVLLAFQWAAIARQRDEDRLLDQADSGSSLRANVDRLRAGWERVERRAWRRLLVVAIVAIGLIWHVVAKYTCLIHHGYCL